MITKNRKDGKNSMKRILMTYHDRESYGTEYDTYQWFDDANEIPGFFKDFPSLKSNDVIEIIEISEGKHIDVEKAINGTI